MAKEMLPPGVVFDPDEKELVCDYLRKKVAGGIDVKTCFIRTIELYKHKPSELKDLAHYSGHEKMYFFTLHEKFNSGPKINRRVSGGCWKKTGPDSPVKGKDEKEIATKTSLTYCTKDPTEEKTKWLMKEYKLIESQPSKNKDDDEESKVVNPWILCVVYPVRKTKKEAMFD